MASFQPFQKTRFISIITKIFPFLALKNLEIFPSSNHLYWPGFSKGTESVGSRQRETGRNFQRIVSHSCEGWKSKICKIGWQAEYSRKRHSPSKGILLAELCLAWKGQSFVLLRPSSDCLRPTHILEGNLPI